MALMAKYHGAVLRSSNFTGRETNNTGTLLTAATAAHTLSPTFTDLFSATTHDAYWLQVAVAHTASASVRTDALCSIYIGASGSEQLLVPSLLAGWSPAFGNLQNDRPRYYRFPIYIPSGSRLSAKCQALETLKTMRVWASIEGGGREPNWVGQKVDCIGVSTASSIGTSITPGTTAEGSFVTVGTTTTQWGYALPMIQGTLSDIETSFNELDMDIGSGDALYQNLQQFMFLINNSEYTTTTINNQGAFVNIPSGTALQLRGQVHTATAEAFDAAIYGVF